MDEIVGTNVGCRLGLLRINILAYADDLVLISDSQDNLAKLYGILHERMQQLHLSINKIKSKAMIFKQSNRSDGTTELMMGDDIFEVVSQYKYLGHILEDNLQDIKDIELRLNSFYGKFNWVFRNFKNTSLDVLTFLFNAYCTPDYGLPLWYLDELLKKQAFKTFQVAYNNAIKRMLGVPISSSSHAAAEACNILLLNHHSIFAQTRFYKRILRSNNSVLRILYYNLLEGFIYKSLSKQFDQKYSCKIRENGIDILKARIFWVQRHEDRTGRQLNFIA